MATLTFMSHEVEEPVELETEVVDVGPVNEDLHEWGRPPLTDYQPSTHVVAFMNTDIEYYVAVGRQDMRGAQDYAVRFV